MTAVDQGPTSKNPRRLRFLGGFLLAAFLLGSPGLVRAQRDLKNIPDPDPEIERQSFQLADGVEVNLFAADPRIAKPIQMNFDPEGRLWIVSSEVYPQIKPGQTANDKVLVLEDADGDGRAEKTTVFAEGLLIPTGVAPGDGGVYVGNSTELLHLKDTDGDGHADTRRVVLSGFGTEDTHHIIHTLRWGPDGMLYFNQSIYIHSHIETPWGVRRLNGGGTWQFRPETMQLEVFTRGLVNPWGTEFDRWGQTFGTDGAGGEGINYMVPGAGYTTAVDMPRILQGLNPGSPKHCGLEVVSGRHAPEDWQGLLLTNDFRANRVCRFELSDDGSGFASRELPELIKTTHPAFRPIDIRMGPDGAIYIADWYNPIIQHGEVDFRDPRRDHTHGRIWRVTFKDHPLVERPKLVGAPVENLLDSLKAPEIWTRRQARQVLKERGAEEVVPALAAWVEALDSNDPQFVHNRLEALWTFQALDVVRPELLEAVLSSDEPRARAAAARVVGYWAGRLSDPLSMLERLVTDENPRVRLEAARALGKLSDAHAAEVAMRVLDMPMDRFLDYGLWLTARDLAPAWLPALEAGRIDFDGKTEHLVFALNAVGSPAVVKPLVESYRAGKIAEVQQDRVLAIVAALGDANDLGIVLDAILDANSGSPDQRARLLRTLTDAARSRKAQPSGDLGRVAELLQGKDDALRSAAARAIGAWGLEKQRPDLMKLAADQDTTPALRRAALDGIASLGGDESRQALSTLADKEHPPALRMEAVAASASIDSAQAARDAVRLLAELPGEADPSPLIRGFLQRQDGPEALTKALEGQKLPADMAKRALRTASASARKPQRLIAALTSAGGLDEAPDAPSQEDRQKLLADVAEKGDPARGETVFRRADAACLKCHAIAGAGGQVGPGLESIGASAPVDYLLDSLLEPDKAVKEGYHSLVVATTDGRVITGIQVRQTGDALILRDAEDQEITIPISDIDEQKTGGSLMPADQVKALTRDELIDVVRFLSELGKVGPYSVGQARVARRWQLLDPQPGQGRLLRRAGFSNALNDEFQAHWKSAYSTVAGNLPKEIIPAVRGKDDPDEPDSTPLQGMVRTDLEVSTAGTVSILTNAPPETMDVWLDGQPVASASGGSVRMTLEPGTHSLAIALRLDRLPAVGFRCELVDVAGSPAKVKFVLGK